MWIRCAHFLHHRTACNSKNAYKIPWCTDPIRLFPKSNKSLYINSQSLTNTNFTHRSTANNQNKRQSVIPLNKDNPKLHNFPVIVRLITKLFYFSTNIKATSPFKRTAVVHSPSWFRLLLISTSLQNSSCRLCLPGTKIVIPNATLF
jgi:hypothetical protein